jgi:DNA-binding GntR family transcriptional regulator
MSTPMFQKIEPVSKKARVVALLKDAILSGLIQSGEQIVETKIAQQFGVGQGLIREALIDLEHQGFVTRMPFSGTQVPKLGLEDAQQIFDIRIRLEPLAIELAGRKITRQQLSELQDLVVKAKQSAESDNLDLFFQNHLAFRRKFWELSANKYIQQALERLVTPLFALYLIGGSFNRDGLVQTVLECIEHEKLIMKALDDSDPAKAGEVARDFLVRMKNNLGSKLLPRVDEKEFEH